MPIDVDEINGDYHTIKLYTADGMITASIDDVTFGTDATYIERAEGLEVLPFASITRYKLLE